MSYKRLKSHSGNDSATSNSTSSATSSATSNSTSSATSSSTRSSKHSSRGSNVSESYKTNIDLHGDIINNYNVINKIGGGSFSNVWLVYSIKDNNFYALKVQNYDDYEAGYDEIKFLKNMPKNEYINNLIDSFVEKRFVDEKIEKFMCSVYNLCCMNVHDLFKMKKYEDGLPYNMAMNIFKQLCNGVLFLHSNMRVYHGDIKPENILVCGINKRDKYYIDEYKKRDFVKLYSQIKEKYWTEKGNKLTSIKNMSIDTKLRIRRQVHQTLVNSIGETKFTKLDIDNSILDNIKIKLSDFGSYCSDDDIMEDVFGTQHYMAPEMLLMDDCRKPVDIWALGCTLYELLTNRVLFDPDGKDSYTTDLEHIKLIIERCGYKDCMRQFSDGSKYHKFFKKHNLICSYDKTAYRLDDIFNKKIKIENKNNIINILHNMLTISPGKRIKIDKLIKLIN